MEQQDETVVAVGPPVHIPLPLIPVGNIHTLPENAVPEPAVPDVLPPAEARKRRKAIISSQRSGAVSAAETVSDAVVAEAVDAAVAAAVATGMPAPEDNTLPAAPVVPEPVMQPEVAAMPPVMDTTIEAIVTETETEMDGKRKKTQIRYDPSVPMDKEHLAVWRREARRVRNRESAAASRQRIRSRIEELESEVSDWKSKYTEAVEKLKCLEELKQQKQTTTSST